MVAEERLLKSISVPVRLEETQVGDFRIQYAVAGAGKPIILIHGVNIGWGQWYLTIPELAKDFTVYSISLPGSGGSTKIDFHTGDPERFFVDTMISFIQQKKMGKVSVIGHSLGGWIAFKMALKVDSLIEKIVTINSVGFTRSMPLKYRPVALYPLAKLFSRTVMKPTRSNIGKYLRSAFVDAGNLTEEFIDYYYETIAERGNQHPFFLINRIAGFWRIKKEFMFASDDLKHITSPVLLIIGGRDPLTPLAPTQRARKQFPNARIEIFPQTGHIPAIEQPKRFHGLIKEFLSG